MKFSKKVQDGLEVSRTSMLIRLLLDILSLNPSADKLIGVDAMVRARYVYSSLVGIKAQTGHTTTKVESLGLCVYMTQNRPSLQSRIFGIY
jgi:hypothetical protein